MPLGSDSGFDVCEIDEGDLLLGEQSDMVVLRIAERIDEAFEVLLRRGLADTSNEQVTGRTICNVTGEGRVDRGRLRPIHTQRSLANSNRSRLTAR